MYATTFFTRREGIQISESGDYSSTSWVHTHDFTEAKKAYKATVVDRSYSKATTEDVDASDLVTPNICIDKPTLIVIADVTGSMGNWPTTMFSKLPYLLHELKVYLGEEGEFLISAVGDATCDRYPLQVQKATNKYEEASAAFSKLVIEGGGGSSSPPCESYDLAAAYFLHAVSVNKNIGIKPILVFIGDENFYDRINPDQLRPFGIVNIERKTTKKVFEELNEIYDIYFIQKPYSSNYSDSISREVTKCWSDVLPKDHVIPLQDPERVVDILYGILGNSTNKVGYFKDELIERQEPKQVTTVLTSLSHLIKESDDKPKTLPSGKSTYHKLNGTKTTKRLI